MLDAFRPHVDFPEGRPVVPDELLQAGRRWNNEAQIYKLYQSHPNRKDSFRIAVVGDAEHGRFPWQRIFSPRRGALAEQLRSMQALGPDFMIQLGDFVSLGDAKNYVAHVRSLDRTVGLPMISVIGNHDRSRPNGEGDKQLYQAVFGRLDFYFDYNGWRFIVLDTSDRRLRKDQILWLELALATPLRKMIFTHVPPAYLKGQLQGVDVPDSKPTRAPSDFAPNGYWGDVLTAHFEQGSSEFGRLVAEARVERIYMGHIHALGTATYKGVRYVLSGAGGSPLYPLPPGYPQTRLTHFIDVQINPEGVVQETVYPLDGTAFPLPPTHSPRAAGTARWRSLPPPTR